MSLKPPPPPIDFNDDNARIRLAVEEIARRGRFSLVRSAVRVLAMLVLVGIVALVIAAVMMGR